MFCGFDMETCALFVAIAGEFLVGILVRKNFFSILRVSFCTVFDVVRCQNAFKVCAHMLFSLFLVHCSFSVWWIHTKLFTIVQEGCEVKVAQSRLTLCHPMDCSTPGVPVHHHLPELAQSHAHGVGDASNHLTLCRPLLLLPQFNDSKRSFYTCCYKAQPRGASISP